MGTLNKTTAQINDHLAGGSEHRNAHDTMGLDTLVHDADSTGLTDSSAAFLEAAGDSTSKRRIVVPNGRFRVGGLPFRNGLYYDGRGRDATELVLAGADHMFKAGTGALTSGGVRGFAATGNATSDTSFDGAFDFVNLTAASSAFQAIIADNYATRFRSAYRGSQDDRDPRIRSNSFWNSVHGMYIINNHPLMEGVNDIRGCQWGITGENIYDFNPVGQKVTYCQYGIVPQPGFTIQNTRLIDMVIAFNTIIGTQLHKGSGMFGGQLLAHSATANARGVVLTNSASVVGVEVQSFGLPWTVAAVCIANTANASSIDVSRNKIARNGSRIGTFLLHEPSNVAFGVYHSSIEHNHMFLLNAVDRFVQFLGPLLYSSIFKNTVDGQVTNTVPVISVAVSGTYGNDYSDNMINQAGGSAYAIDARVPASTAEKNKARRGGGFNFTNGDINTNKGISGGMTIPATNNTYIP